ncbi:hypothetical protein GCM10020331_097740 [Ectobacillus funiculus]
MFRELCDKDLNGRNATRQGRGSGTRSQTACEKKLEPHVQVKAKTTGKAPSRKQVLVLQGLDCANCAAKK